MLAVQTHVFDVVSADVAVMFVQMEVWEVERELEKRSEKYWTSLQMDH